MYKRGKKNYNKTTLYVTLLGVDNDRRGRHEPELSTVAGHHQRSVLVVERRYDLVLGAVCLRRAHRPALLLGRVGAVGRGAGLTARAR